MTTDKKLYVVVGLGKTGLSCVRFLRQQGLRVAVTDSRKWPPFLPDVQQQYPEVTVSVGQLDPDLLAQASCIVMSPGVSLAQPVIAKQIERGALVSGDIELFARHVRAPIIAITGSNGKSTVTTLVGEMAKAAGKRVKVGGNLGLPVLDMIDAEEPDLYVLELSSFQLETTDAINAAAATILNITPDHMDRYNNFEEYVTAKSRIYRHAQTAVINRDDALSSRGSEQANDFISFGLGVPQPGEYGVDQQGHLCFGEQMLLSIDDLKIKGRHQVANVLAAFALGSVLSLPIEAMVEAALKYTGLAHRCQWVCQLDGVDWYNDSKGTNVGATIAAISGIAANIKGNVVLIAGGLSKNADTRLLHPAVKDHVRSAILIGQDAKKLAHDLQGAAELQFAASMQEAVSIAKEKAEPGDVVMLSPACASFDMFRNFQERGDVFVAAVRGLKGSEI